MASRLKIIFRHYYHHQHHHHLWRSSQQKTTDNPSKNYSTKTGVCTDKDEVDFHADMASLWWDKNSYFGPLQELNEIRVPFIRDSLIESGVLDKSAIDSCLPLKDVRILDVGCGGGVLSEELAKCGAHVVGLDPSEELIELARCHAESSNLQNIRYVSGLIEDFAEKEPSSYDVVVASEVIEHVTEKSLFTKYCVQAAKHGGSVIFTTPARTLLSRISVIYISEMIGLMAKGTHQFSKFISPEALKEIVNGFDCETKTVRGYSFNPWTRKCYFTNHKWFCYMFHAVKNRTASTS